MAKPAQKDSGESENNGLQATLMPQQQKVNQAAAQTEHTPEFPTNLIGGGFKSSHDRKGYILRKARRKLVFLSELTTRATANRVNNVTATNKSNGQQGRNKQSAETLFRRTLAQKFFNMNNNQLVILDVL